MPPIPVVPGIYAATTDDESSSASADNGGGDSPPSPEPPMKFEWGPPVAAPPTPPTADGGGDNTGPGTLGSDDVGGPTAASSASTEQPDQSSSTAPDKTQSDPGQAPPPDVPSEQPETTQQINALLRSLAIWLAQMRALLGLLFELDPRVRLVFAALEGTLWLAEYLPKIFSYLDSPKTLEELQNAVGEPALGYETHHIVEAQKGSDNPQSNAQRFSDRIDSSENLVRVPYWKHVEISSWYSSKNELYNGLTPRNYLRGTSWDYQYGFGLDVLRKFGVMK